MQFLESVARETANVSYAKSQDSPAEVNFHQCRELREVRRSVVGNVGGDAAYAALVESRGLEHGKDM